MKPKGRGSLGSRECAGHQRYEKVRNVFFSVAFKVIFYVLTALFVAKTIWLAPSKLDAAFAFFFVFLAATEVACWAMKH